MTWTDKPPTRSGVYLWKLVQHHLPVPVEIISGTPEGVWCATNNRPAVNMGGLWCGPLVPAEEVEKAYKEGLCEDTKFERGIEHYWNNSRAKRVMEGKE